MYRVYILPVVGDRYIRFHEDNYLLIIDELLEVKLSSVNALDLIQLYHIFVPEVNQVII